MLQKLIFGKSDTVLIWCCGALSCKERVKLSVPWAARHVWKFSNWRSTSSSRTFTWVNIAVFAIGTFLMFSGIIFLSFTLRACRSNILSRTRSAKDCIEFLAGHRLAASFRRTSIAHSMRPRIRIVVSIAAAHHMLEAILGSVTSPISCW